MKTRRRFLAESAAAAFAFTGMKRHLAAATQQSNAGPAGYGALRPDPAGILELPLGFEYRIISKAGDRMDDGFIVPAAHDGMGAFNGPNGTTILIRNHELSLSRVAEGAFGSDLSLRPRLDSVKLYDAAPGPGGTTTLVYDTQGKRLERHFLSLAGTLTNCAGGPTPWNTWISCEENVQLADAKHRKDHGFNFEVPASAADPVDPVPLKAMGRFNHEAIAVGPNGVVYQTEDRDNGLLYRFVPSEPGKLAAGGRLQALAIQGMQRGDTSNWNGQRITPGKTMEVRWIDIENVESPNDDLRLQGAERGAATFARGEGIWTGRNAIYFACTSGGPAKAGQIWVYTPSAFEGASNESERPSKLELFVEPNDRTILERVDNITVAPWGDLILCEDGPDENSVKGVTPGGDLYPFARNAMNSSEFAGAVFSPDGSTLFVNIQNPGLTLAITGPWRRSS